MIEVGTAWIVAVEKEEVLEMVEEVEAICEVVKKVCFGKQVSNRCEAWGELPVQSPQVINLVWQQSSHWSGLSPEQHCQGHSSPSSKQSSAQRLSTVVGARTRLLKQATRIASYLRPND